MPNHRLVPIMSGTSRAMDYMTSSDYGIWVALGRTTAWDNDLDPPAPDPNITDIEEPVLFKQLDDLTFVIEDGEGDIVVGGITYSAVSNQYARDNIVTRVYNHVTFTPEEIKAFGGQDCVYRQVAIYSKLIPSTGHEADTILDPNDIDDFGYLEWISNREPVYVQPDQLEIIRVNFTF